jgi:hypothetical protein
LDDRSLTSDSRALNLDDRSLKSGGRALNFDDRSLKSVGRALNFDDRSPKLDSWPQIVRQSLRDTASGSLPEIPLPVLVHH